MKGLAQEHDKYRQPIERSQGFDPVPAKPLLVDAKRKAAADAKRLTGRPDRARKDRLPPGQDRVTSFPTLDLGSRPLVDAHSWSLTWGGLCAAAGRLGWREFNALGVEDRVTDIHCVTGWSRFDNRWRGVPAMTLLNHALPSAEATHVIIKGHDGFGTALALADLRRPDVLLATHWEGTTLTREHGGPVRLVVPHLYFWKSAKWVKQIWFTRGDPGGYWENRGYHHRGDPWKEERYG